MREPDAAFSALVAGRFLPEEEFFWEDFFPDDLEPDLELVLPEFYFTSETACSARLGFFFSAITDLLMP